MKTHDNRSNVNIFTATVRREHKQLSADIIKAYDSVIARAYCKVRFNIIDINILEKLSFGLKGKVRVLEIGCGFGLFGCYFSALYPEISFCGYDIDSKRIEMAERAAKRLGLTNVTFRCEDARQLKLNDQFDAIMMIDLLHHIDDNSKDELLATCTRHLTRDGLLIIKDVTTYPFLKLVFTWTLDVLMTRGLQMWYWNEEKFHKSLENHFSGVHTFRIKHWLPYPHILYLCENLH